jgi:catechol 2,3-dioxygenase-like lactoylglutathione lyase family enzyme
MLPRRSTGIHHVDLVVSDLGRSLAFYRAVLEPLGWCQAARRVL